MPGLRWRSWTSSGTLVIDWLKKLFGLAKQKAVESAAFKHMVYVFVDGILVQAQAQCKNKSAAEIDAFFTQKRAELKQYFGE